MIAHNRPSFLHDGRVLLAFVICEFESSRAALSKSKKIRSWKFAANQSFFNRCLGNVQPELNSGFSIFFPRNFQEEIEVGLTFYVRPLAQNLKVAT